MADQPAPAPLPVAPSLVGREREQAALRDALAAALAGHGSLVLIGGEAGIGKSSLAEELCVEAAAQGVLVLVGRCFDLSETPPYGPWQELFGSAPRDEGLPLLPTAVLPPERAGEALASQGAIMRRVRDYLAALSARRPVVLLLEDLHWADPASLDLLRVVARGLGALPVLILATYRAEEVPRGHPLYALLPVLAREARAARLDPRPLGADDVRALARWRYRLPPGDEDRLVAYLTAHAEGNPFYVGELLRSLEELRMLAPVPPESAGAGWALGDLGDARVPPLLRQVLDARLDRLGDGDRDLLEVAAVLGQEVPLALWAAVGEVDEGVLLATAERAVAARLLDEVVDGGRVRFHHALTRAALYEGLGAARRRAWHRRAGEALAKGAAPDPDAVAHHFGRAGDARTGEWLIRAGERAERAYAWLTAAERYEAALALMEIKGRERAVVLATLAQLRRYGDRQRGIAQLDEAARLAEAAGDHALAAACRFDHGHLRCLDDEVRRGLEQMLATLPILEALPEAEQARLPTLRLLRVAPGGQHFRGALVIQLANAGRLAEARDLGAGILARASGTTARGLLGVGVVHADLGQPELARRAYADARAAFRAAGEQVEVHRALCYELDSVAWPYLADQPGVWQALADEADQVIGRASDAQPTLYPRGAAASFLLLGGAWSDPRPFFGWSRSILARYQGDADLAWARVHARHPDGPATEPGNSFFAHSIVLLALAADLALDAGDLALAEQWIAAHGRWLDWSGATLWRANHLLLHARHARQRGDHVAASRHAEAALTRASHPRQPVNLLVAHRVLGELAADAGRHADSANHLAAALTLADACAAPYERALTLIALAESRLGEGSCAEATAPLAEARAICVRLEARPSLARIAALEACLSVLPVAPSPTGGLSRREAEVLGLLAAGRNNREIAKVLFLSPRTVQRHVANAYAKIGAHNKADATAYALRHGLA